MRIGLISDSHIPASTRTLPEQVFRAFEGCDLILHAGDIYVAAALDALEMVAPVLAVGESIDLAIGQPRVLDRRVIDLEGVQIGLIHKLHLPGLLSEVFPGTIAKQLPASYPMGEAMTRLFGSPVDVCVFGDTHYEVQEEHGGTLILNPGSPTLPRQMMRLGTVGLIEIEDGQVTSRLVALSELPGPAPLYI